jgi:hypothetical protein
MFGRIFNLFGIPEMNKNQRLEPLGSGLHIYLALSLEGAYPEMGIEMGKRS